jgi:hypothetical protein
MNYIQKLTNSIKILKKGLHQLPFLVVVHLLPLLVEFIFVAACVPRVQTRGVYTFGVFFDSHRFGASV